MPLQSHSKPSQEYIIFSVYKDNAIGLDNKQNHAMIIALLKSLGVSYKELRGCYEGQTEQSIIVNRKHIELIIKLAMQHKQESLLLLEKTEAQGLRKAKLYYLENNAVKSIGYLRQVSKERALKQECFTHDYKYNNYYITVPTREVFKNE